jgi:hypothetical protein
VLNDITIEKMASPHEDLYRRLVADKWNQAKRHCDYKKARPRRPLEKEEAPREERRCNRRIDFTVALDDDESTEDMCLPMPYNEVVGARC